ncbi:MAG: zinc ABC transporter substrate-binding protein [Phycisphaerae bacterium]|nr:zinc ABC transporter substrate-binding protein [Phycisphaerae bacterium]
MIFRVVVPTILFLAALPGCERSAGPGGADVAASNSLLECAAKDLLGGDASVLRLAEPGMCPGHFDIRPSQVQQLRRCCVLLRMDFQESMDAKLAGAAEAGLKIVPVHITGGLCEPASYLAACKQTAEALVGVGLLKKEIAAERLRRIEDRMKKLSVQCLKEMEPLKNESVICSVHQEAFCRWLGLDVVATFRGTDVESVKRLDKALQAGKEKQAKLVVANRPEGRRCADFLAERLEAKAAVFDNFPATNEGQPSFDDMVRDNIKKLLEAN